ncbi:MAG: PTS glucose transporter subunit IIA [Pelosinus sp.]|nr:PTS glucose transporter subunit IIA [Pelosinus sp.]
MFDIFSKKINLLAPVSGKVIAIENVPDAVFAQKTVGDGAAIDEISGDVVCAPVDGTIELVFRTNHAFALKTKSGVEVLVHIGINTVELGGKGFERLVEEGQTVKAGDPVIKIDKALITEAGFSLVTPVVITNMDKVSNLEVQVGSRVNVAKDTIITFKKK